MVTATFCIVVLALTVLVFIAFRILKDAPDKAELVRLRTREQDFEDATFQLENKTSEIESLQIEKAKLEANLENERTTADEKLKLLQDSEARLKTEFENLATKIFEDKGHAITEQNRERISGLLQPLKEQLESFRQRKATRAVMKQTTSQKR